MRVAASKRERWPGAPGRRHAELWHTAHSRFSGSSGARRFRLGRKRGARGSKRLQRRRRHQQRRPLLPPRVVIAQRLRVQRKAAAHAAAASKRKPVPRPPRQQELRTRGRGGGVDRERDHAGPPARQAERVELPGVCKGQTKRARHIQRDRTLKVSA